MGNLSLQGEAVVLGQKSGTCAVLYSNMWGRQAISCNCFFMEAYNIVLQHKVAPYAGNIYPRELVHRREKRLTYCLSSFSAPLHHD